MAPGAYQGVFHTHVARLAWRAEQLAEWAGDAYRAAGQPDDWARYLADVRATHGRKYKLMGLLKGL